MKNIVLKTLCLIFVIFLGLLLPTVGAEASSLVTGKQIKDSSLTSVDFKDGSLTANDFK